MTMTDQSKPRLAAWAKVGGPKTCTHDFDGWMYCACPKCAALALDAFAAQRVEQARAEERVTVNLEHLEAHRQVVEDCAKWEDAATALRAEDLEAIAEWEKQCDRLLDERDALRAELRQSRVGFIQAIDKAKSMASDGDWSELGDWLRDVRTVVSAALTPEDPA
jgi:hypothetical protein